MAVCQRCGASYTDKRKEVGYNTCLECGEWEAALDANEKSKQVAIAYNKGPYMYITNPRWVKDIGKK